MISARQGGIRFGLFCLAAIAMLMVACASTGPEYLRVDPLRARGEEIGKSVDGRPIRMVTLGKGPETILILATIHGNENAGTPLSLKLIEFIDRHPEVLKDRTILIVPVVNPDGYFRNERFNSNHVDLNRNFPAFNRDDWRRTSGPIPLSEPESNAIKTILDKHRPRRIVSMHEPLRVIDWDGPGAGIARHMGNYTSLPVNRLGSRPGSLGSHAGEELKIPIITLEFPKDSGSRSADDLWRDYGLCLLSFITYPDTPPPAISGRDLLRKERPSRPAPTPERTRDPFRPQQP